MDRGALEVPSTALSFCRAPMVAMEFDPYGDVQACCANALFPIGNVREATLEEIWRGPRAEALRDAVARRDLSLGCTVCRHRIDHGEAERPYEGYAGFPTDDPGGWPMQLSFALSNTCNLECVMCGADRSSRIRSRRAGLPALPDAYGSRFFEEVVPFLGHCKWADFVGGEPFLVRHHFRVWSLMEENGFFPPCGVTTNGTVWNERVEHILDTFDVDVRISIDGWSPRVFEDIRVGARHNEVFRNLMRFRDYADRRGTNLIINWCLLRHNWFELPTLLRWAEGLAIRVLVMTVAEPEHGAQHMSNEELAGAVARMEAEDRQLSTQLEINLAVWRRQLEMLQGELDRRRHWVESTPCMEPPDPSHVDTVACAVAAIARSGEVAPADRLASERGDLLRWTLEVPPRPAKSEIARLCLDHASQVVAGNAMDALLGPNASPDDLLGQPFVAILNGLQSLLGSHVWLIEQIAAVDVVAVTLLFGGPDRDKRGTLIHLRAISTCEGAEVLLVRDDRFQIVDARGTATHQPSESMTHVTLGVKP